MRSARLVLVGALLCASCAMGLSRGLWTPDEPREAGISRQMYEHPGVIPALNGEPFIEKPPLYYWTVALAFRLAGGPSASAARAVSAIASTLVLLIVFVWVRRSVSDDAAVTAALILASTNAFITSAHWVRIDAVLMLFCAMAMWAAWEVLARRGRAGFLAVFYAALILALWTKGLVGPVLIAGGLVGYAALSRRLGALAPLRPFAGIAVMAAGVGALAAAIAMTGGGEALRTWFFVNHVQRFVHPVSTGHEAPLAYYLWTLPLAVAPWLVPFAALFHVKGALWRAERPEAGLLRYALAMVVVPLLVLSASSSKREVYLLPLLPALAVPMAIVVRDWIDAVRRADVSGWSRACALIQAAILIGVGLAPPLIAITVGGHRSAPEMIFISSGVLIAFVVVALLVRRRPEAAFFAGAAAMGVALVGADVLIVPRVDAVKDFRPFMAEIDKALPAQEAVPVLGADETVLGILPFYTGRRVVPLDAHDPPSAKFVLVQSSGTDPDLGPASSAYDRIAYRTFGPSRRMALWRKKE